MFGVYNKCLTINQTIRIINQTVRLIYYIYVTLAGTGYKMVLGVLTAVLMGLECSMLFLKHCKKLKTTVYNGKKGKFLLMLHKVTGFLLLAAAALHLATSWKLMQQRPLLTYITGVVMVVCIALAAISFLLRGKWKKWRAVHRLAAGLLLILLAVHILSGIVSFNQYTRAMSDIEITNKSAAGIPDGAYIGECDAGYIYAKVRVDVSGETITNVVVLEHRNERGGAAEAVTDDMVRQQNVRVDAVSGATNSSRVIMKAAENALESVGGD